ncbi:MAG: hypothetical protein KIH64_004345 [Mycobacterium sp.]|nr:hypothetical protein [Mycobacterium sp.]
MTESSTTAVEPTATIRVYGPQQGNGKRGPMISIQPVDISDEDLEETTKSFGGGIFSAYYFDGALGNLRHRWTIQPQIAAAPASPPAPSSDVLGLFLRATEQSQQVIKAELDAAKSDARAAREAYVAREDRLFAILAEKQREADARLDARIQQIESLLQKNHDLVLAHSRLEHQVQLERVEAAAADALRQAESTPLDTAKLRELVGIVKEVMPTSSSKTPPAPAKFDA